MRRRRGSRCPRSRTSTDLPPPNVNIRILILFHSACVAFFYSNSKSLRPSLTMASPTKKSGGFMTKLFGRSKSTESIGANQPASPTGGDDLQTASLTLPSLPQPTMCD